tara:strand:- start:7436 stop:8623 length:1188 start_codon:yes stop_codon:yes gene_type:complete
MIKKSTFPSIALIRVDYNIPIKNETLLDLNRIEASIPTIQHFLKQKKKIVLMSHFGRPKGRDSNYSLRKLIPAIEKLLKRKVSFVPDITESSASIIRENNSAIVLLENLRFYSGEQTNDMEFAKQLSMYGDIYINDAFGVSHRNHASVSAITKFFPNKNYKGLLLERELKELKKLKNNNIEPYTIIVGGSKIGSKIHMLKSFLNVADNIIIGGGMAFPFIKHLGGGIGNSICQESELEVVKDFLHKAKQSKTKLSLPKDCLITNNLQKKTNQSYVSISNIPAEYIGVDIGPKTIRLFSNIISDSKLIMWNGPMGISEVDEYSQGSRDIADIIVKTTKRGSYSLLGGGDTISDISRFGLKKKFSYISTGGGAMLDFFKNENLPGTKDLESITKLDF